MHPAIRAIRNAIAGTAFEHDLWLVGGAVRDEMLGLPAEADFDLVTKGSSAEFANLLYDMGVSSIHPVTYERFGTAMVQVEGVPIEVVTARRESYDESSRKPIIEPASLLEDATRRDFTVNTLMRQVSSWNLLDPLGTGLYDLRQRVLRTPLDSVATFRDDPLRMLRAVRFRWKLGFHPAPGLYDSIRDTRGRLQIVSMERIRDEVVKILGHPTAPDAMSDLMALGLFEVFLPEFLPMVGCEQGSFHHLDVWDHTLLVLRNAGSNDRVLSWAALLHDVGKPATRFVDEDGNTRFFGHESLGAEMTREILRRLKLPQRDVDQVASLVKNHMRLGSSPEFTASAARRLLRDMGGEADHLIDLVEADSSALRPGVRAMDLSPIRERIRQVAEATPPKTLVSPLTGEEIMEIAAIEPGPEVGRLKAALTERVLDGSLAPNDREAARRAIEELADQNQRPPN